mmetsp:Transcript_47963/g.133730  ORF Transcript_47963/g.133730 Transcript_47963/m.133730 type:complete len:258 (-) Transcript_47963:1065-1838(-)
MAQAVGPAAWLLRTPLPYVGHGAENADGAYVAGRCGLGHDDGGSRGGRGRREGGGGGEAQRDRHECRYHAHRRHHCDDESVLLRELPRPGNEGVLVAGRQLHDIDFFGRPSVLRRQWRGGVLHHRRLWSCWENLHQFLAHELMVVRAPVRPGAHHRRHSDPVEKAPRGGGKISRGGRGADACSEVEVAWLGGAVGAHYWFCGHQRLGRGAARVREELVRDRISGRVCHLSRHLWSLQGYRHDQRADRARGRWRKRRV